MALNEWTLLGKCLWGGLLALRLCLRVAPRCSAPGCQRAIVKRPCIGNVEAQLSPALVATSSWVNPRKCACRHTRCAGAWGAGAEGKVRAVA